MIRIQNTRGATYAVGILLLVAVGAFLMVQTRKGTARLISALEVDRASALTPGQSHPRRADARARNLTNSPRNSAESAEFWIQKWMSLSPTASKKERDLLRKQTAMALMCSPEIVEVADVLSKDGISLLCGHHVTEAFGRCNCPETTISFFSEAQFENALSALERSIDAGVSWNLLTSWSGDAGSNCSREQFEQLLVLLGSKDTKLADMAVLARANSGRLTEEQGAVDAVKTILGITDRNPNGFSELCGQM